MVVRHISEIPDEISSWRPSALMDDCASKWPKTIFNCMLWNEDLYDSVEKFQIRKIYQ